MLVLTATGEQLDELAEWCRQNHFAVRRPSLEDSLAQWDEPGVSLLSAAPGILDVILSVSEYTQRHDKATRRPLVLVDVARGAESGGPRGFEAVALRLQSWCWVTRLRWPDDAMVLEKILRRSHERHQENEFLARVVHELATPVATVRLWHSLLESTSEASIAHALDNLPVVRRSVMQLQRFLEDLRGIERLAEPRFSLRNDEVDINDVAASAVASFALLAQEKSISLEMSRCSVPALVLGDEVRLLQVFNNLLANAIKFTPIHGIVSIGVRVSESSVVSRVADSGEGMASDRLAEVSRRGRTQSDSGGMGLGLAIVRDIVEQHGGSLSAYSDGTGAGSVFEFILPALARG